MLYNSTYVGENILSLSPDAYIESENINYTEEKRKIENAQILMNSFSNIQQANSTETDVLKTSWPILEGLQLYDIQSKTFFTAGTVTEEINPANIVPYLFKKAMLSNYKYANSNVTYNNNDPLQVIAEVFASVDPNDTKIKLYFSDSTAPKYISFEMSNYIDISQIRLFSLCRFDGGHTTLQIQGYNEETLDYDVLGSFDIGGTTAIDQKIDVDPQFINNKYKKFKLFKTINAGTLYVYALNFFPSKSYTADISIYSQGQHISQIIPVPTLSFNNDSFNINAIHPLQDDFSEIAVKYESKKMLPFYNLKNTIHFNYPFIELTEIYCDILPLELEPIIQTDNNTPYIVTASSNIPAADAYLVFDGTDNVAFSVACDASGVPTGGSVEHIIELPSPEVIYRLVMKTGVAANAPKHYKFEGSVDGTTYDTILDVTQDISVDNLELTKTWDSSLYKPYSYYKITILQGPASGNVEVLKYLLYKEKSTI